MNLLEILIMGGLLSLWALVQIYLLDKLYKRLSGKLPNKSEHSHAA